MVKPKDRRKGRKGSNHVDKIEQARVASQNIHTMMQETLTHLMESMELEDRVTYFKTFPPTTQATLLNQFIPKQRDTDQDLVASHISLTKSYERLPSIEDLSERCRILTVELRTANNKLRHMTFFAKKMFRNADAKETGEARKRGIRMQFFYLLKQIYTDHRDHMIEMKEQFIPLERWMDLCDEILAEMPDEVPRKQMVNLDPVECSDDEVARLRDKADSFKKRKVRF